MKSIDIEGGEKRGVGEGREGEGRERKRVAVINTEKINTAEATPFYEGNVILCIEHHYRSTQESFV